MAIINGNRTKADLTAAHRTRGSFNKAMRMDAKARYEESGRSLMCKVCGEQRQVDICHITPIETFEPSACISQINGPDNLVVLCPLHHRLVDQDKKYVQHLRDNRFRLGIHLIIDFDENIDIAKARHQRDALKDSLIAFAERDAYGTANVHGIWVDE